MKTKIYEELKRQQSVIRNMALRLICLNKYIKAELITECRKKRH